MNKIRIIFCIGMVIVFATSCEKYLEPKLTNDYGDDITWRLPDYATGTLGAAYGSIDQNSCSYKGSVSGNNYLDALTDNALTTYTESSFYQYVFGSTSIHSNPIGNWNDAYNAIAMTNLFLEKGFSEDITYHLAIADFDSMYRSRAKGEAYFLRAWWQMELLRNYGGLTTDGRALGYVIATRTFSENERETANAIPRSEFEDCVQQIFKDCDSAFYYLPLQYSPSDNASPYGAPHVGRASGKAALALKSRIALLAASPAYQPKNISESEVRTKWLRAAVLAQEAITKGEMGKISNMIPMTNNLIVGGDVNNVSHTDSYNEMLFYRFVNGRIHEQHHYPPLWFGQGKCNPSQNLVNAYPMTNGYPITDSRSGYDSQNPYSNKDRRLTLQVNYNGGKFNELATERELEIWTSAADGTIGRDAAGFDYRNTWTGYYIRKGMSSQTRINYNPDNPGVTQSDYHRNPLLRRTEVWMNLAEACNEFAGPNGTAPGVDAENTPVAIIKRLRTLYGTGNDYVDEVLAQGKEKFRDLILQERRIEFAFENMRLWDIRRWKLPLNTSILGIRIFKGPNNKYVYFGTSPEIDDIVVQDRHLLSDEKYYTSPIPYAEMVKNKNLVQNAGW